MKLLNVNDKKATFVRKDEKGGFTSIELTKLGKKDILFFLQYVIDNDNVELCDENPEISNDAEKIIYQNISAKLNETIKQRKKILDEVDNEFSDAISKYTKK